MIEFISNAMAGTAASVAAPHAGGAADSTMSLLMIAGIFVLFYFMLIRPQNKRAKEHRQLISQLKAGDEIVSTGGMLGKVTGVDEQYIKVTISEGVVINLQRTSVSAVLPKGTIKSL